LHGPARLVGVGLATEGAGPVGNPPVGPLGSQYVQKIFPGGWVISHRKGVDVLHVVAEPADHDDVAFELFLDKTVHERIDVFMAGINPESGRFFG